MRLIYFVLVVSIFIVACSEKTTDKSEHMFCNDDYVNHSRAIQDSLLFHENLDALVNLYDDHAVCLFGNMDEVNGKSNIYSMFNKIFDENDSIVIKTIVNEIMSEKDWAIERSSYTLSFQPLSSPNKIYQSGHIVTAFQKVKDEWKIMWQISNTSPVPTVNSSLISTSHKEL